MVMTKHLPDYTTESAAAVAVLDTFAGHYEGVREIDVTLLTTDSYQRPISDQRVTAILRHYHPHAVQPIKVSLRGGVYYVMDGQHTLAVEIRRGKARVECKVWTGLSFQEEADIFLACNSNSISANYLERFNARIKNQEPVALLIMQIVREEGFFIDLNRHTGKRAQGHFYAVDSLESIYERGELFGLGGENLLRQVLTAVRDIFNGQNNEDAMRGKFIGGLGVFLGGAGRHRSFSFERFRERFVDYGASSILQEARVAIQYDNRSVPAVVAGVFLKRYVNDSKRYFIPDYYLKSRNPQKLDEVHRAMRAADPDYDR